MNFNVIDIISSFLPVLFGLIPILLVFGIFYLIFISFRDKVHVKWRTFKGKGFKLNRGDFGLYVYCGAQGR